MCALGFINPPQNDQGPEIRLLACTNCKTIEVLDDYKGPQNLAAEYDVVLNLALEKHRDGVERREHIGQLFRVKQAEWNKPDTQEKIRKQVIARFDPNAETGLGHEAYALRDTFLEDAMTCWGEHQRNPACPDYKSDAKQLIPNTQDDRREAGIPKFDKHNPSTKRYLCEWCPVHSLVQQAQREKAGLYDA